MYYVQEADKPMPILKLFNIIKLENDKIILPITTDGELTHKKAEKLAQKTKKILDKTNCNKLILSNNIKNREEYINYLYTYNMEIVDGKWLFELLSSDVIEYVVNKKGIKKEETLVSILVNDITENLLGNIKKIVREYKTVNIVTNHTGKFKNIEEQILENEGIMMIISNNKRKSLAKSRIILNVDFPTELINKYTIYEEAVIINLKGNVKINKKRFNGLNINDYKISFNKLDEFDYYKKNLYAAKEIYEAGIYKKQPFEEIQKKMKQDKLEIVELIGNKSKL